MPGIGGRDQHVCFLLLHRRCVSFFKLLMKAADTQLINLVFRSSEAAIKCWPLYFHMLPREDTQGPRQLVYIIGPPPRQEVGPWQPTANAARHAGWRAVDGLLLNTHPAGRRATARPPPPLLHGLGPGTAR